ncbi:MAG: hypothetical protein ACXV8I_01905 [Methylobacter sp.]
MNRQPADIGLSACRAIKEHLANVAHNYSRSALASFEKTKLEIEDCKGSLEKAKPQKYLLKLSACKPIINIDMGSNAYITDFIGVL